MILIQRCLLIAFLSLGLVSCKQSADEDGVMQKMAKMQAEINALKNELAVTNAKVDALKGKGKRQEPVVTSLILKKKPVATAKVAIVEFTDYQCPYCARHVKQVLPSIRTNYIDKGLVHYEIRDFPLSFHANAKGAAVAANCVDSEDYWPMHDWIFNNTQQMNNPSYIAQAKVLGNKEQKFTACLADAAIANAVDADEKYGRALGVSGTPKFFIGKIAGDKIVEISVVNGAAAFERFDMELKQKLQGLTQ